MSIFDKAKKQKAARGSRKAKAGSAKAKAAVVSVNGGDAVEEPTTVVAGAPWANPECRACKGRGLTSKGKACPICNTTAKKGKRPTSMAYVLELDDAGLGVAVAREESVESLEAAGMALEWIEEDALEVAQAEAAEAPQETAEEPQAEEGSDDTEYEEVDPEGGEDDEEPSESEEPAQVATPKRKAKAKPAAKPAAKPKAPAKKAGRPTVGLTILLSSAALRGVVSTRQTVMSSEVLVRFGAELAEDIGAEDYYDLDTFKRRERLAQKAAHIVSELGRVVLIHPGVLGNDDVGSLVQALMAQTEGIEGIFVGIG